MAKPKRPYLIPNGKSDISVIENLFFSFTLIYEICEHDQKAIRTHVIFCTLAMVMTAILEPLAKMG